MNPCHCNVTIPNFTIQPRDLKTSRMNKAVMKESAPGASIVLALVLLSAPGQRACAAVALSGESYSESFDGVASGVPSGWTVRTGATISSLGTEATLTPAGTSWGFATGHFRNAASSDGLTSGADATQQANSADRILAVRQTGTFGDPGAAFVLEIANSTGFQSFNIALKAQMLDIELRSTTWTFDYRIGASGNFTSLGSYADPGAFGSTTVNFDSTQLAAWNDQASAIYFRVVALDASTGSDSRDTFGIDDFSLTFTAVPEPAEWGLISACGLLSIAGFHSWRSNRRARASASA